jgi:hypothetical protein
MEISSHVRCPSCQGSLRPVQLRCDACDLTLEGRFAANEFARLDSDELHFLRIFIHCEGHIRDMESALGVSYPTIKARLAKLKQTLAAAAAPAQVPGAGQMESDSGLSKTLTDLQTGHISFEQAMARLKKN